MIIKKKKKKKGKICQFNKYEIYYEIYYINSIACARYSRHCNGFSLYPHKNKRCDIDDLVFGPRDKALVIVMSTTFQQIQLKLPSFSFYKTK